MSDPITAALVGAGIGAVGGAATGNSPFKGALLGGGLGFGGASLLGAGGLGAAAGGASAAGTAGTAAGEGLIGGANLTGAGIASGTGAGAATNVGTSGIIGSTGEMGSNMLQSINPATGALTNAGAVPLSSFDKAMGAVNKFTAPIENWSAQHPYMANVGGSIAKNEAMNLLSPQQQMAQPSNAQVSRPQFNPESIALHNVAPRPVAHSGSEIGLMGQGANAVYPNRKIQFYQDYIG